MTTLSEQPGSNAVQLDLQERVAVLLVGYGDVDNLSDLVRYNAQALNLLVSKFVPIPAWLYPWLGRLIAIANQREYRDHNFLSPHNQIFEAQRVGIERHLQEQWGNRVQVFKAFNSHDSLLPDQVLQHIRRQGFSKLLIFPLLVVNSVFTSGIVLEQINQGLKRITESHPEWLKTLRFIPSFHDQPAYLDLVADLIRHQVQEQLGFAHLPTRIGLVLVNQGSPKHIQGFETGIEDSEFLTDAVKRRLMHEYPLISIGWFNHDVPFSQWPTPTVAQAATNLIQLGASAIAVAPIGTATENRETILDLDYIIHDLEQDDAAVTFLQLQCVNDHPDFLAMAAEWAKPHITALLSSE